MVIIVGKEFKEFNHYSKKELSIGNYIQLQLKKAIGSPKSFAVSIIITEIDNEINGRISGKGLGNYREFDFKFAAKYIYRNTNIDPGNSYSDSGYIDPFKKFERKPKI